MNQRPVSCLDRSRWSAKDYSARGEKTTIGASGCGPTAMAMVLATWADPQVTPATGAPGPWPAAIRPHTRGPITATSPRRRPGMG